MTLWTKLGLCFSVLALLSCKPAPTFSDPAKEARYMQYVATTQPARKRFAESFAQQPIGFLRRLRQATDLEKAYQHNEAFSDTDKKLIGKLLDSSAQSKDPISQLIALAAIKACMIADQTMSMKDEDVEQFCVAVPRKNYTYYQIPEFVELAELAATPGLMEYLERAHQLQTPMPNALSVRVKANVIPIFQRQSWQDTSQWAADIMLKAWSATSAAETVPAPEEFKDYQVDQVDMVYENLKIFMGVDLYAQALIMLCDNSNSGIVDADLSKHQRQALLLKVIRYTKNQSAWEAAIEAYVALAGTDLTPELKAASLELEQLKTVDPFDKLADLTDLKKRLETVRRVGTLGLAQQRLAIRRTS